MMAGERGFYLRGRLDGRVIPKQRPRFDPRSGRAYTDPDYRDWLDMAADTIGYTTAGTLTRPGILRVVFDANGCDWELQEAYFSKKRGALGDIDNLSGAVMDALQQGKALKNDGLIRGLEGSIP